MRRRIVLVGTLLAALVGAPRPSDAGLLEIIWEMSGPRMLGLGYGCLFTLGMKTEECRVGSAMLNHRADVTKPKLQPFIVLGAVLYGSTGHDTPTQSYEWGEVWMLALEPGLAVRTKDGTVRIHHGAGISYDWVFGREIRGFDKFAFTLTPLDVAYKRVAVGVKLRFYPNGFTDDEFKPVPKVSRNRPAETTLGFTFSVILKKP